MPTEIKNLTISDEGLPTVQAALDRHNITRISSGYSALTLDEFVQSDMNGHLRIRPGMLVVQQKQKLVDKLTALSVDNLAAIDAAIDAELGKVVPVSDPVEPLNP